MDYNKHKSKMKFNYQENKALLQKSNKEYDKVKKSDCANLKEQISYCQDSKFKTSYENSYNKESNRTINDKNDSSVSNNITENYKSPCENHISTKLTDKYNLNKEKKYYREDNDYNKKKNENENNKSDDDNKENNQLNVNNEGKFTNRNKNENFSSILPEKYKNLMEKQSDKNLNDINLNCKSKILRPSTPSKKTMIENKKSDNFFKSKSENKICQSNLDEKNPKNIYPDHRYGNRENYEKRNDSIHLYRNNENDYSKSNYNHQKNKYYNQNNYNNKRKHYDGRNYHDENYKKNSFLHYNQISNNYKENYSNKYHHENKSGISKTRCSSPKNRYYKNNNFNHNKANIDTINNESKIIIDLNEKNEQNTNKISMQYDNLEYPSSPIFGKTILSNESDKSKINVAHIISLFSILNSNEKIELFHQLSKEIPNEVLLGKKRDLNSNPISDQSIKSNLSKNVNTKDSTTKEEVKANNDFESKLELSLTESIYSNKTVKTAGQNNIVFNQKKNLIDFKNLESESNISTPQLTVCKKKSIQKISVDNSIDILKRKRDASNSPLLKKGFDPNQVKDYNKVVQIFQETPSKYDKIKKLISLWQEEAPALKKILSEFKFLDKRKSKLLNKKYYLSNGYFIASNQKGNNIEIGFKTDFKEENVLDCSN